MASLYHPFDTDCLYQRDEDGNIRITNGNSVGIFTRQGIHISGDIRHADPQLCVWVGNVIPEEKAFQRAGKSTVIHTDDD